VDEGCKTKNEVVCTFVILAVLIVDDNIEEVTFVVAYDNETTHKALWFEDTNPSYIDDGDQEEIYITVVVEGAYTIEAADNKS